jgi:hypothetical protein
MRAISRFAIGAAILVSASVPALAGSNSIHSSPNPSVQPIAHSGAIPLARKITTSKGCDKNCMRGHPQLLLIAPPNLALRTRSIGGQATACLAPRETQPVVTPHSPVTSAQCCQCP